MKRILAIPLIALLLAGCTPATTEATEDPCRTAAVELAELLDDVTVDVIVPITETPRDAFWISEQIIPLAERQQDIEQGVLASCIQGSAR